MSACRDCIVLKGLAFYAYHGALPEERRLGQTFLVNLELFLDLKQAGQTDNLEDTINYAQIYDRVRQIMEGPDHHLLESLAEKIAGEVLAAPVQGVRVEIQKPAPPIEASLSYVAVQIQRGLVP